MKRKTIDDERQITFQESQLKLLSCISWSSIVLLTIDAGLYYRGSSTLPIRVCPPPYLCPVSCLSDRWFVNDGILCWHVPIYFFYTTQNIYMTNSEVRLDQCPHKRQINEITAICWAHCSSFPLLLLPIPFTHT